MSSTPGDPRLPGSSHLSRARPAALLAVRITPADVGSRVTVRHRLHDDPEASLTDVVGTLLAWSDGGDAEETLRVERRDGTIATILVTDVVAAKVVPPPPPRRSP